jgi:hypothetical protein
MVSARACEDPARAQRDLRGLRVRAHPLVRRPRPHFGLLQRDDVAA